MLRSDSCPDIAALASLVDDSVAGAARDALRAHVDSCSSCAESFGELADHAALGRRMLRALGRTHAKGAPSFAPAGFTDLREIGRGGMGVVFSARQIDPPRDVALKVIRSAHAFDEHALALFRRETRALARLQHPGIAALHDAGLTASGEPFLVMELVHGAPLLEYATAHELSIEERVRLLVQIARAVQAAHQRGVIHRDLKPANVLVDVSGQAKVLDFGLAKIDSADEASPSLVSLHGSVRGTLPYMSPEQSSGRVADVDSRTDVYSLGVVLYELLTGRLPIDVAGAPLLEAARRINEVAPLPPSTHERRLRGDLDTIVLKALSKDPQARYASAAALGDDLERHLANEVILARPPSGAYLLRKLVARHRAAFALLAGLLLVSLGSALWLARLYSRADRLRGEAEAAARAAQTARDQALASEARMRTEAQSKVRVSQLMVYMIQQAAADDGGDDVRVADVLPRAEAAMHSEVEEHPQIAAVLGMALGEIQASLGKLEASEELLRFAIQHEPTDERLDWDAVRMRGVLARLLMERGEFEQAEALIDEADSLVARIEEPNAVASIEHRERRAALNNKLGRHAQAETQYRELLAEYAGLESDTPEGEASLLGALCVALQGQRKFDEVGEVSERQIELFERAFGAEHTRTLMARGNLAGMHMRTGKVELARDMYESIAAAHERALGPDHIYTLQALHNLGNAWNWLDQEARALEILEPTLERERRVLGPKSPTTIATLDIVAGCQYRTKRYADAERTAREMYSALEGVFDAPHDMWLRARFNLGRALYTSKHYEECERVLLEGWNALEEHGLTTHSTRSGFAKFLTTLYDKTGRTELANQYRAP